MRFRIFPLFLSASFLLFFNIQLSAVSDSGETLVIAEGFNLSRSEIEEEAASRLKELEMENLRAPARDRIRRHRIISDAMKQLASEKLLSLEAAARDISVEELAEVEIDSRIVPLSAEEMDKLLELNKGRLQGSEEEIRAQIAAYVKGQREKEARQAYIDILAAKYDLQYRLPPVRFDIATSGHPSYGPDDAPVTVVEFSDFECPHCAQAGEILHKIYLAYEGRIRIIFRQYPLWMIHSHARKAAEASLCASEQGKFWEMHNLLFEKQDSLDIQGLKNKASQLELDRERFDECLDSGRFSDRVDQDLVEGSKAGVGSTPAFFINGRPLEGRMTFDNLRVIVEEELKAQAEKSSLLP